MLSTAASAAILEKKMKKLVLALGLVSTFVGVQAIAQTVITDADGNGSYSFEEMQAAFADLTQEVFDEADVNDDGQLDADELAAAQESGLIPA